MNVNSEELLTKKQFAGLLKLSQRSVDRKIQTGDFPPGLKLGGAVRWRKAEIERWISEGCPSNSKRGR